MLSASSAEKGRTRVIEAKPDLIMDIIMAGEHGYAAIEDLKSQSALASVHIVIFSGVTHRGGETTASRFGWFAY